MFFELVSIILFAIVPDYGNDYMTKENNNWTSFKNLAPKLNLNHNISTTAENLSWQLTAGQKEPTLNVLHDTKSWHCCMWDSLMGI